jgi:dephospho-CoA kinase
LIVVYCRPELQLERLVKRDGLTAEEAARRIAAQMPQDEKKSFADYLIDTSGNYDETREQVWTVYEHLKRLAAEKALPAKDS